MGPLHRLFGTVCELCIVLYMIKKRISVPLGEVRGTYNEKNPNIAKDRFYTAACKQTLRFQGFSTPRFYRCFMCSVS